MSWEEHDLSCLRLEEKIRYEEGLFEWFEGAKVQLSCERFGLNG